MKNKLKNSELESQVGYAYRFGNMLCKWAMPSKLQLSGSGVPTPEAEMIRVKIVPFDEYHRLKKLDK